MKHSTLLLLILCLPASLYSMEEEFVAQYETDLAESGKEAITNYFQSSFYDGGNADDFLLQPPAAQQEGISFSDFQGFYEGVLKGLDTVQEFFGTSNEAIKKIRQYANFMLAAESYESLYTIKEELTPAKHLHVLLQLVTSFSLKVPKNAEPPINFKLLQELLDEGTVATTYSLIETLDEYVGEGNITAKGIAKTVEFFTSAYEKNYTKEDFSSNEDYEAYLKTLINLANKIHALKKSPSTLYTTNCDGRDYANDPITAAKCISLNNLVYDKQYYEYLESFLQGIKAGLDLQDNTLGRIYALKKLRDFIKALPKGCLENISHDVKSKEQESDTQLEAILVRQYKLLIKQLFKLSEKLKGMR